MFNKIHPISWYVNYHFDLSSSVKVGFSNSQNKKIAENVQPNEPHYDK